MNFLRSAALLLFCSTTVFLFAQNAAPAGTPATTQYEVNVSATPGWTDTHVDLHAGDIVQVAAVKATGGCNANGLEPTDPANLAMPASPAGALIAKLSDTAAPFLVGSGKQTTIVEAGRLFLAMNGTGKPPCEGSLVVKVQLTFSYGTVVKGKLNAALQTWMSGQFGTAAPQPASSSGVSTAAASGTAATPANASAASHLELSKGATDPHLAKQLDAIPRRVTDEFNNQGDMVNFVIVGSQQQLQSVLDAAQWHMADEIERSRNRFRHPADLRQKRLCADADEHPVPVQTSAGFRIRTGGSILRGRQPPSLPHLEGPVHVERAAGVDRCRNPRCRL
jgi:hypothetical protein